MGCAQSCILSRYSTHNTNKKIYTATRAKIIKVIDGDTYDIAYFDTCFSVLRGRIRLYGVDTCELKSRDPLLKARALAAKKFAEDSLLGKIVHIDILNNKPPKKINDKYGRLLAKVYLGKVDFAQELIAQNYAVAYDGGHKLII